MGLQLLPRSFARRPATDPIQRRRVRVLSDPYSAEKVVRKNLHRLTFAAVLLCGSLLAGPAALSANSTHPHTRQRFTPPQGVLVPCNPLERRMFADAADGTLDEHSLAAAALIASGVDDAELLARYLHRLDDLSDHLARYVINSDKPLDRARAVFDFMHREVLRSGYRFEASDLTLVLDEGRFNCVSSAVMFRCLAARLGLDVDAVEVPGHALGVLRLPNGSIDVETTCSRWFDIRHDPTRRKELVAEQTGFAADRNLSRRTLSDAALVAIIYYNRGVERLGREEFAAAVAANFKALWLDPENATAAQNLTAAFNNWALYLNERGDVDEALRILERGLAVTPDDERLAANRRAVYHKWAAHQTPATSATSSAAEGDKTRAEP